jgi:hypothetical protein
MASNAARSSGRSSGRTRNRADRQVQNAADSRAVEMLGRAGLIARGVIYVLIGALAVQIAVGSTDKEADRGGAIATIGEKPFGEFLLWALAVGFAGMALWRLSESITGQPGTDGKKATKRLESLARGVFYTVVCVSLVTSLTGKKSSGSSGSGGGGGGDQSSRDLTAKALDWPGGRILVGAVGVAILAYGVYTIFKYITAKFEKKLYTSKMSPKTRKIVKLLGRVGGTARGTLFAFVGAFLLTAAYKFDANKAKGVDDTLRSFRDTPAGPYLLVVIAIGLAFFGAYSICESRWRKLRTRGNDSV